MEIPEDFKELLRLLNSHGVEFLVVGGYALGFHGVPRYTGDLDLFVAANAQNGERKACRPGRRGTSDRRRRLRHVRKATSYGRENTWVQ